MNYNIDHNLLKDPYIVNLKGKLKVVTWIVYSFISHFTRFNGGVDFYTTKFADDWQTKPDMVKQAIDGLIKVGYIKRTRLYQRKGNIPARYEAVRYIQKGQKVYPKSSKGISKSAKVNNYNNNYKPQDDDFNQSSPVKLDPTSPDYWKLLQQMQYNKNKK